MTPATKVGSVQGSDVSADEAEDSDFKPLTAAEAKAWRARQPVLSLWRVVRWQCGVGVAAVLLAALVWGGSVAQSVGYGALAVVIPSAIFARGLSRQQRAPSAGAAMAGFVIWEAVKVGLTVVMLALAPKLVPDLSWVGLVAGLVLTLKVYGLALLWRPGA